MWRRERVLVLDMNMVTIECYNCWFEFRISEEYLERQINLGYSIECPVCGDREQTYEVD